ncbi:hypothetical protein SEPCBS57363_002922 [Sporothrix epigloea]|uniref:BHLH domain-containing protein n=1 Tax=Sporothrix epigloea TaxID=1892477 RepID=A0ABP0DIN4_9PEZI
MPRAALPPTPASSTDIQGKDGSSHLVNLHLSFELPPPALASPAGEGGDGEDRGSTATTPTTAMIADINMLSPPLERDVRPSTTSKKRTSSASSSKSAYPVQASETVKSRRRSSAVQAQAQVQAQLRAQVQEESQPQMQPKPSHDSSPTLTGNDKFSLPPPPTRSRKIIQMKPRTAANSGSKNGSGAAPAATPLPLAPAKAAKGGAAAVVAETNSGDSAATEASTSATAGKKKQPTATSAAGRKIARKTAHSLIERRRRSKMNEEFAVLKSMVPACTGEMHKLAILQASIEYVRYLEDCVAALKSQRESDGQQWQQSHQIPGPPRTTSLDVEMTGTGRLDNRGRGSEDGEVDEDDEEVDKDDDLGEDDMDGAHTCHRGHPPRRNTASASPALLAQDHQHTQYHQQQGYRQDAHRKASPATSSRYSPSLVAAVSESFAASATGSTDYHHRHHGSFSSSTGGFTTSAQTSPAFGPQQHSFPLLPLSAAASPYLYGASGGGMGLGSLGEQGTPSARASISGSTLTSPALLPQQDMDHEATAALLMLNSDRRGTSGSVSGGSGSSGTGSTVARCMRVKDLLST